VTAIWALTAQAIMVALAYIAACATAGAFAAAAITQSETAGLPTTAGETFRFLVLAGGTTVTALGQAFYPALVAVALSEGLKLRGIVFHLVAGVLTGVAAGLPLRDLIAGIAPAAPELRALQLFAAAGAAGGLVYWLIAGRTAGRWLELRWFEPNRR